MQILHKDKKVDFKFNVCEGIMFKNEQVKMFCDVPDRISGEEGAGVRDGKSGVPTLNLARFFDFELEVWSDRGELLLRREPLRRLARHPNGQCYLNEDFQLLPDHRVIVTNLRGDQLALNDLLITDMPVEGVSRQVVGSLAARDLLTAKLTNVRALFGLPLINPPSSLCVDLTLKLSSVLLPTDSIFK